MVDQSTTPAPSFRLIDVLEAERSPKLIRVEVVTAFQDQGFGAFEFRQFGDRGDQFGLVKQAACRIDGERLVYLDAARFLQWASDGEGQQVAVFLSGEDQPLVVMALAGGVRQKADRVSLRLTCRRDPVAGVLKRPRVVRAEDDHFAD